MAANPLLVQGVDYYLEDGKLVFTAEHHLKRGHCCNSKCRHCPYGLAPSGDPQLGRIEIQLGAVAMPGMSGMPVMRKPKGPA